MDATNVLRVLLAITIAAMMILALLFLRQRDLPLRDRIGWGILAVFIPLLGPFLVILHRPGRLRNPSGIRIGVHPVRGMVALLGPRRKSQLIPSSTSQKDDLV